MKITKKDTRVEERSHDCHCEFGSLPRKWSPRTSGVSSDCLALRSVFPLGVGEVRTPTAHWSPVLPLGVGEVRAPTAHWSPVFPLRAGEVRTPTAH